MARETFIDNPVEEDKNCSIHNIFTLLQNEEEVEDLDVVLASTDSTTGGGAVNVADCADVAELLQWLRNYTVGSWDDINGFDFHGRSALHWAFIYGASWEVINGLLGKLDETVINAIDKLYGHTALHFACKYGASWEVINGLLGKLNETAINAIDTKDGYTALHYACMNGASWEVINGLLGKLNEKAINAIDKLYRRNALHVACECGASWEVINGLLGKLDEKVINAIDDNGRTALHIACANKASWEVINRLLGKLDKEAINAIDNQDGETAFHYACRCEASSEVIIGLLGKLDGKVINAIDDNGRSALHNAACKRGASSDVINGLLGNLNEKAINAIDNQDGETALHNACRFGASPEVINAIVTHTHGKKLLSVKNVKGKLPFDIFPDHWEARDEHLKNLLKLHDIMEFNDPYAFSYPNGLLQSIFYLPHRDEFEFMNHSYFRKAINAKIIQTFSLSILFLDVAVQGLVMAVFSFTINGAVKELPTTSMAGLIPCLLWLLFREIVQYLSATAEFYFGDAANFVDLIQIVLVIAVLLISFIGKGTIDEGLLVACIGVAWTRLIFVISNLHYSLALFVAALLQVIKVLIPFMLVVSMICAAVAHIFHALYPLIDGSPCYTGNLEDQDCEWTSSLTKSYFHTFAMTLTGDWEFLTSNLGPLSYLAMIFAFTMGIILMNMLIAVISNKYTEVEAKSEVTFWESRFRYIIEVESMKSIIFMSVKETSFLPFRISMDEVEKRDEWIREQWKRLGGKYEHFLSWKLHNYGDDCPTFLKRMSCFLEMAKWSEIFSISEGFRLCFLGINDSNKGDATWLKHAMAWVGLFGIVFVLCLYAVIVTPLGLLTGGYLWTREVKEYLFWGIFHVPELSSDSKILKEEIDELKKQNKEQIDELKEQINELKKQNKEQMKQILDALAGKNA
eukprot:scaffold1233_cov164-Chaetoceros_neogracile.AAC.1